MAAYDRKRMKGRRPEMDGSVVSELELCRVPTEDLLWAEYCFSIETDYSKAPKISGAVQKLKKIISSLLNCSGGVIILHSLHGDHVDECLRSDWLKNLSEQLSTFIPKPVLQSCVKLKIISEARVFIRVTKSPQLVTLSYHMFDRLSATNRALDDFACVYNVLTSRGQPHAKEPFSALSSIAYGSVTHLMESESIEFKFWESEKFECLAKRLEHERNRRSLFSFANMPAGGFLIIGVKEESNKYVVYGQAVSVKNENTFQTCLSSIMKTNHGKTRSIWGREDHAPECGRDWSVKFIPITNCPNKERRRLIQIRINHCPGGTFAQAPEAYGLSEDGYVHQLSYQCWREAFTNSDNISGAKSDSTTASFHPITCKDAHPTVRQRANFEPGSITGTESSVQVSEPLSGDQISPTDQSVDEALRCTKTLSWTEHRKQWSSNLTHASLRYDQNCLDFIKESSILKAASPLKFTPGLSTIIDCSQYPFEMKVALADIQNSIACGTEGFAIASANWLCNVQHSIPLEAPPHQLLDVVVVEQVGELGELHLWTLVEPHASCTDVSSAWGYVLTSGRLIKRAICSQGRTGLLEYQDVSVVCHLYKLGEGELYKNTQTKESLYDKDSVSYVSIQSRVARVLMGQKTYIRTNLGLEQEIHMTSQQTEHLLASELSKFNYIEGPPGCGKTYLALRICDKYPMNTVGYVCTTVPFEAFLVHQNRCIPILIQREDDLMDAIHGGRLDNYRCVIIDDIHNMACSEIAWLNLLERAKNHPEMHLFIFADSRFQNFKTPTNMASLKKCLQEFCDTNDVPYNIRTLSVVHRNTRKVVSFLKCCIADRDLFQDIASSSVEDGDDIEVRYVHDAFTETADNQLLALTTQLVDIGDVMTGGQFAYEPTDIAILIDTPVAQHHVTRLSKLVRCHTNIIVHGANTFPVLGLTVDTLDNFMGLDRRVCICLTSTHSCGVLNSEGRSLANPKYKAFIASRGVCRVIFVVDTPLTAKLARNLKLNNLPSKATHPKPNAPEAQMVATSLAAPPVQQKEAVILWHVENMEEIADVCFLNTHRSASIVYITAIFTTKILSIEGEPSGEDVQMNVDTIQKPVRTAGCREGCKLVLTDRLAPYSWTVFSPGAQGKWTQAKHGIDGKIDSVCWTPNGDLVMIVQKSDDFRLMRFTSGGWPVWDLGKDDTQLRDPRRLSVGTDGHIFVPDLGSECVRVYDSRGRHTRVVRPTIGPGTIKYPRAVCVNSSGDWLLISHGVMSGKDMISVINTAGGHLRKVIETSGRVWALSLHQDRYLAVGTTWGLLLYDVSGVFWT